MQDTDATTGSAATALPRRPAGATALALVAGLVFGVGLIVSGLADPSKVLAFLDVAGDWDPALLVTMAAAVTVGLVAHGIASRRTHSLLGLPLPAPVPRVIDRRLLLGGLLFGVGWGLAGICPGPSFVAMGSGSGAAALFAGAMLAGIASFDRIADRTAQTPHRETHHVRHTTR